MGEIIRCLTADGSVMAMAAECADIVSRAEQIHRSSAVVTAGLGRLLIAASLMGTTLKNQGDSVTLKIHGGGPTGTLMAIADCEGNVRGYAQNPVVEIPLKCAGKLDVGGAVGNKGMLYVIRDTQGEKPYSGCIPLVSGEVAEDITAYYAQSEQIPTACALGVSVNPDLTVQSAGGLLLQLLPGCPDEIVDQIEKNIALLPPITALFHDGRSLLDILHTALKGFSYRVTEQYHPVYRCTCSRERVMKALLTMKPEERMSLPDKTGKVEVTCRFCDAVYTFHREELFRLA